MASKARSALVKLKARKDEILKAHGARTPMDTKILHLIGDYSQIVIEDDADVFLQARFDLCDLHLARGDVLSGLKTLVEASELKSERATKKAADIMSRINTKKYTRAVKSYKPAEIRDVIRTIMKNSEEGFSKKRLQIFYSIYRKDFTGAIQLSGENIPDNPKQGVSDFVSITRSLAKRANFDEYLPAIGKVINVNFKEIIDQNARSIVQELQEKYRDDASALQALSLDPQNSISFAEFVSESTFTDLLNFVNNNDALLFADGLTEEDKDLLIDELGRRVMADAEIPQRTVLVLLQKASNTLRFWSDAAWRSGLLESIQARLAGDPDHHGDMALGIIAYLAGDESKAQVHFSRSTEGDSPFSETGATSFLAAVAQTSASEKLLNLSGITIDEAVLKDRSIVTCSDEIYFKRYAMLYLTSLRKTGSNCPVHFHIAGNKIRLKSFIDTIVDMGEISFSYETPPLNIPAYYASMRFLKAPYFIERVARHVLLTDIDVAFRSDPGELIDKCIETKSDVTFRVYDTVRIVKQVSGLERPLYRYPRTYPWAHVNAACLCLTSSELGKEAAKLIARDMAEHLSGVLARGKRAWWVDQNALLFSYRTLLANEAIRIGNIEDFGMPYGSFDYADMRVIGGSSPSLTAKVGRRIKPGEAQRKTVWGKALTTLRKVPRLLRRRS